MRYLLDTNIVSEVMRAPASKLGERTRSHDVCTSILVAGELKFGAAKVASAKLRQRVDDTLRLLTIQSFEPPADERYASLRASLHRAGTPISDMDMLIAAHALALDMTLVTANEREFERVPDLRVENWLR